MTVDGSDIINHDIGRGCRYNLDTNVETPEKNSQPRRDGLRKQLDVDFRECVDKVPLLESTTCAAPVVGTDVPVLRVLFTGGPGAGKSSAMACLRERLSKQGYHVLFVPETATRLFSNCGFDPSWPGTKKWVEFHYISIRYQMEQEEAAMQMARLHGKPAVVLCDRGVLDGKLFCSDDQWSEILEGMKLTEDQLFRRYDVVLHMTTCARGLQEHYGYGPGSSNPERFHNPEQAKDTDLLAEKIFENHPQVRTVLNFEEFDEKMDAITRYIVDALGIEGLTSMRGRERVPVASRISKTSPYHWVTPVSEWPLKPNIFKSKVTYLDAELAESVRSRVQVSTEGDKELGMPQYEYRKEGKTASGSSILSRRILTDEAYGWLIEAARKAGTETEVTKTAACFTFEHQYFEAVAYEVEHGELCVTLIDRPVGALLPHWFAQAPRTLARYTTDEATLRVSGLKRKAPEVATVSTGSKSFLQKLQSSGCSYEVVKRRACSKESIE